MDFRQFRVVFEFRNSAIALNELLDFGIVSGGRLKPNDPLPDVILAPLKELFNRSKPCFVDDHIIV